VSARGLLGHLWRRHRVALAALAAGSFLFQWVFTRAAPTPSKTDALRGLLALVPPAVMDVFGADLTAALSPQGFLALGWAHPFPLLMMAVWVVRVGAASVAGEIGRGTMDLVASRPVPRAGIAATALAMVLGGLAAIVGAGWVGTAVGLAMRPLAGAAASQLLPVAGGAWLLFAAFGAMTVLISAARRHGGEAISLAAALMAVSFALDYLARAWRPIAWARPLSLFAHYEPRHLLGGGIPGGDALVLGVVGAVCAGLAFAVLQRRDL
jgi:ABC-2 type transport system permease protein